MEEEETGPTFGSPEKSEHQGQQADSLKHSTEHKYPGEVLSLEKYPDNTTAVLAALTYRSDQGELCARGKMRRTDVVDNLSRAVDLNKDQVKYRLERLLEEDPQLVLVSWRDHREYGPTGYYWITDAGLYVLSVQQLADHFFEEADPISESDAYQLLSHLKKTREMAEKSREEVDSLQARVTRLEDRLK